MVGMVPHQIILFSSKLLFFNKLYGIIQIRENKMKWSLEKIHIEALKYQTRGEFAKGSWNAYQAANNRGILDVVCSHMIVLKKYWTIEELQNISLKYDSRGDFQKFDSTAYNYALKNNLLDSVCNHMFYKRRNWTNEELHEEALKYNTRSEFEKNNRKAYDVAMKRKILNRICGHMANLYKYDWTYEEILFIALKYKTRSEFKKFESGAYAAAKKMGIIEQICSHMKTPTGSSIPELELMDILKKYVPNLTKKSFEVNIFNKPYIHRFQIDILDSVTKLGIEYDGEHHHSKEFLIESKTKRGWPIEDAINYHQIKDNALLDCHGISLLHIKGEDWKKNKQDCIQKCLVFLGVLND